MIEEPQVDDSRVHESNKARRKYIILIIICFVIVAAIIGAAIFFVQQNRAASKAGTGQIEVVDENSSASKPTTTVPNLVQLFGKTPDEALAALGSKASVSSTAAGTTTIVIASDNGNTTTNPTNVYLGLDAEGRTSEVIYNVSFESLGNATMSFAKVLADTAFLSKTLTSVGIDPATANFALPDATAYETRTTAANGTSVVTKEEYSYSGQTGSETAPTAWEMMITFDRSSATGTSSATAMTRSLKVHLY